MTLPANDIDLLNDLIAKARQAGADAADSLVVRSVAISHAQRLGTLERLQREESYDLGLRVLIGQRQAIASSTDLSAGALSELVERAIAMAKSVPEDQYCGLASPEEIATQVPDLDICDPEEPAPETLIERAKGCEEAARAVDGVTNSEGAEAGWSHSAVSLAASNGFHGCYELSGHSLGVSVLAGEGLGMERDYDFSSAVHGSDLEDPAAVGERAGQKTVRRLGAKKAGTGKVPVIFDPRVSNGLLRHLAGGIGGNSIARGTSFLKDSMGQAVFGSGITIVDDPHRQRGLRSKPFDGEGVVNARREIVKDGRLTTWILDLRSARQLGLKSTGHASRGTSGPPSPATTNLFLEPGPETPEALLADIDQGFYITDLMGMGINMVTGDYSRGAAGFWIDKGEITYPVSEMTVAGNLKDMFAAMVPANDLAFRYGINAPTIRIDGMTVAGA